MFTVLYTKEDKGWEQGHSRGGFTTYIDAFNWAVGNVVDGYCWKIDGNYREPKKVRKIRLSLHTNTTFTCKE